MMNALKSLTLMLILIAHMALAESEQKVLRDGQEGHGGHLAKCSKLDDPDDPFKLEGLYSIDYLLTLKTFNNNSDIFVPKDWEESKQRILKHLGKKLPHLKNSFELFLKYEKNFDNTYLDRYWEEVPFGFGPNYSNDQQIKNALPKNCVEAGEGKSFKTTLFIEYVKKEHQIIYRFDPNLYRELEVGDKALQFSFAMVHEWLRDITQDPKAIRRANRIIHSDALEKYGRKQLASSLVKSELVTTGGLEVNEKIQQLLNKEKLSLQDRAKAELLIFFDKTDINQAIYWKEEVVHHRYNKITVTKYSESLINLAIEQGELELAKAMVLAGAHLNKTANHWGKLPLHVAAHEGQLKFSKFLLKKGSSIDGRDKFGHTPLFFAILNDSGVDKFLLESGANVNAVTTSRDHDEIYTDGNRGMSVLQFGLKHMSQKGIRPFSAEKIRFLLNNGADPNLVEDPDWPYISPLIFAAHTGHFEAVKVLVDVGNAKLNLCNSNNFAALGVVPSGYPTSDAIRKFLIKRGARPRCKN